MRISDWSSDVCSSDLHAFWVRVIGGGVPGDPATSHLTGTLQDITELKHGEETLRVQARSDPLTGLMNRDAILGEISARLADPAQSRVAVLYIDLDRFKVVNRSEEHTSELQSLMRTSYAVFCLKKKKQEL